MHTALTPVSPRGYSTERPPQCLPPHPCPLTLFATQSDATTMSLTNTISILEALTLIAKVIPVVGSELEAMLGVATHVCKSVEVCLNLILTTVCNC